MIIESWEETQRLNNIKDKEFPAFIDPFNGRGYIPLEAQRLGIKATSSDINPVATLIGKSLIQIPHIAKIMKQPIGPLGIQNARQKNMEPTHLQVLAEDVRRYGDWIELKVFSKVKKYFPSIKTNINGKEQDGTVLAWLWTRTVPSPNPAVSSHVPLISNLHISNVKGCDAWIEPVIDNNEYKFIVHNSKPPKNINELATKKGKAKFECLISKTPIPLSHIKSSAKNGLMKKRLMAIYADIGGKKTFISPDKYYEEILNTINIEDLPNTKLSTHPQYMSPPRYGMEFVKDIYTERQAFVLKEFCNCIHEVYTDCLNRSGSEPYSKAICTYIAFAIDKASDYWNTLSTWMPRGTVGHVFSSHVLPMTWDFPEANPFSNIHCSWKKHIEWICKVIDNLYTHAPLGEVTLCDARYADFDNKIISTDPPYYDNVPYSDISDYFYYWLRISLKDIYPDFFLSISTPKKDELVADTQRWGDDASRYFMEGMESVFSKMISLANPFFPITIYYAFKNSETTETLTSSRGWQAFLDGIIKSGMQITGTWPLRTERGARSRAMNSNALASSIVLVCRKRNENTQSIPRKQFLREIKEELPDALQAMIGGKQGAAPIAPVDLAQAAIGPGMAVFSRYPGIIEADGSKMSVNDALIQINKIIDEYFNEAEGDMDSDTRFCIDWFMQYGFKEAEYGQADVLARAKGSTVEGLTIAGVAESGGGKVRLLKFDEYPENWDPEMDTRTPTWEALHQLIRALNSGGEELAGSLLRKMSEKAESIRQLAYRLYTLCERKGWAEEARAYNELIASWHGTVEAAEKTQSKSRQGKQLAFDI